MAVTKPFKQERAVLEDDVWQVGYLTAAGGNQRFLVRLRSWSSRVPEL
jgi:hypothetical protein